MVKSATIATFGVRDRTLRGGRPGALTVASALLLVPITADEAAAEPVATPGLAGGEPGASANEDAAVRSAPAVTLEYAAASSCPDPALFKAIVTDRLGRDVFADDAPTPVLVRISGREETFEGVMEWRDPAGNWAGDRMFPASSADCEDLVRAMAFALALRLQLLAVASAPPSSGITAPTPAPSGADSSPSPPPPSDVSTLPAGASPDAAPPPLRARSRPRLVLGAGTRLGFGMSSRVLPFGRLFGGVDWPHGSLSLGAEASAPATLRRADGAGFSHRQLLASAAGCGVLESFSTCLVVKAGEIWILGEDVDDPEAASGPLVELGLRVGVTRRLHRQLYLAAHSEVLGVPTIWSVTLDRSVVYTSPRLAGTLGCDLVLRFESPEPREPVRERAGYPPELDVPPLLEH